MRKLLALIPLLLLAVALSAQVKIGGAGKVGGTVKSAITTGGGGPTASDDFNRADDPTGLGGNWTTQVTALGCQIVSNQATGESSDCYAVWNGAGTFTDNQYSQLTIVTFTASQGAAVGVRLSGAGVGLANVKGYYCGATRDTGAGDDRYKIWYLNSDATPTQVAAVTGSTPTVTSGDVIKLEVTFSGGVNTLTCSRNGSALTGLTGVTDSTIGTGGKPGVLVGASTARADNWSAGAP